MKKNIIEIDGEAYVNKGHLDRVVCDDMEYVIVRTYSAGVFAGFLKSRDGTEVSLVNARRLWHWEGAASLSQLAMEGVKKPQECRFPCEVGEELLTEVIEIIPCTKAAKTSIDGVAIWEIK